MSEQSHVKVYVAVFLALVVFTALTVGASFLDLGHTGNRVVGIIIASIKALLVVAFFMHLKYEKKWIYAAAIFPMVLFFVFTLIIISDGSLFRS